MRTTEFALHAADPVTFPDSFYALVDDFGDPFVNPGDDKLPNASINQIHGDEQSPAPRVKRRKMEERKIVRVPVPEEASSTEFIVPSDAWSWRKYGQKPIKGSPHPRGYYKCSGAKNCTAQKQVERSQADPNTIVVTYISEHNHPCPAQKSSNPSKKKLLSNPVSSPEETIYTTGSGATETGTPNAVKAAATTTDIAAPTIDFVVNQERIIGMEKVITNPKNDGDDLDQVFGNISVDPIIGEIDQWDDIFPCFRELEGDPLGLFMSKGLFGEE
ncbi:putative WRKY transcription factor 14 [Carex rostrata]